MIISYHDWKVYFLIAILAADETRDGDIPSLETVSRDMGYEVPQKWLADAIRDFSPELIGVREAGETTRAVLTTEGRERAAAARDEKRPFFSVWKSDTSSWPEYLAYRLAFLSSMDHASSVLGGGYHDISFALQETVDVIRLNWTIRAAHDLQALKLAEFEFPTDGGGEIVGEPTALGFDLLDILHGVKPYNGQFERSLPASDRTVSIDHNSASFKKTITSLESLEETVRGSNDYGDEEDKGQRLAEISAGRQLLQSPRVSPGAVKAVLSGTLIYLAEKFANAPIGEAAQVAWNLVKTLLGL